MPSYNPGELRLPNLLIRNRNFVMLWCAYGVAAFGDHLSEMALFAERGGLGRADTIRIQALIQFGLLFPFVVLGPLAGWWSDRFSRKTTMIVADLLRAAIAFNFGALVAWLERLLEPQRASGGPYTAVGDFAIVIPLMVVGSFAAFFSPARQALLPTLIRDDQLVRANALISALGTIGAIISAVAGAYIFQHFGKDWCFRVNTLTFLASAGFVSLITMSRTRAVPHPPLDGVWTPVVQGFRYVLSHRRVLQLILLGTVFWAAAGIVISVVPAIVRDIFHGDLTNVALYRGLIGVGLMIGAAFMSIFGPALPLQLAIPGALGGGGFWVLALALIYLLKLGAILTAICLIAIGGAGAALLVTVLASLQRFVPDARRGRVFGVSDMSTMGAMVATTGVLAFADIPNLDLYIPYLLGIVVVGFFATLLLVWRDYRRGSDIAPHTQLLHWIVIFYMRFLCRLRRDGHNTIPRHGPVIVAANHTAGIDPLVMQATTTQRLIGFLVAREYYEMPLAGWFMKRVGCIPIDRVNPGKSFLVGCLKALGNNQALGIFPQGTFAEPGKPPPEPQPGVGLMALRTGAPVIPCHISGAVYHDNPFRALLTRHNVRIRYGPPVDLSPFKGREREKEAHQAAAELIMQKIRELAPGEASSREA